MSQTKREHHDTLEHWHQQNAAIMERQIHQHGPETHDDPEMAKALMALCLSEYTEASCIMRMNRPDIVNDIDLWMGKQYLDHFRPTNNEPIT